jgi:hypothetical protein
MEGCPEPSEIAVLKTTLGFNHFHSKHVPWAKSKRCMQFGVTAIVRFKPAKHHGWPVHELVIVCWNKHFGEFRRKTEPYQRSLPLIGEVIGIATW